MAKDMNTAKMQDFLEEILEGSDVSRSEITDVRNFADAGLLTMDDGIVVKTSDGSEFQITIYQSK